MKFPTDVEEVIRKKREIRKFKVDEIPDEILEKILEAGRISPSSKNSQPWHFIVIKNKVTLQSLAKCTYSGDFLSDAPLAIAVVLQDAKLETDAGRCIQNMMLVAWKYGIGSVWITNFWEKAKQILSVPMSPRFKLVTVIPFGYVPEASKPKGRKIRKPFNEVVHYEKFSKK